MKKYDRITEIDVIEEVAKFNPYHDARGRFSSKGGGFGGPTMAPDGKGGGGGTSDGVKSTLNKLNAMPMKRGISKVTYDEIKEREAILREFPKGTKLKHRTDAGTEYYEKTEDGQFGWWKKTSAPGKDERKMPEFDVAEWFAGCGVISRGEILIDD